MNHEVWPYQELSISVNGKKNKIITSLWDILRFEMELRHDMNEGIFRI